MSLPQTSPPPTRPSFLIVSGDVVDAQMAGPGIRCLELARVLRDHVRVVLGVPERSALQEPGIEVRRYRYHEGETVDALFEGVDAALLDSIILELHRERITRLPIPLAIDLYDPHFLENIYIHQELPPAEQQERHFRALESINRACVRGDFFICAHERQRDWWLGLLQANGRLNPITVQGDPTLRGLIDEVPFGLPTTPPPAPGGGPKRTLPFLSSEDKLILWGGGIWNWLDPLTVIQAMPGVLAEEPRARLLFPGTRHPNTDIVPDMEMRRRAVACAEELGLSGTSVFFGDWVPYAQWPGYVADADVAVSLHFDTPETRFAAVRSRILSYIWTRLPMVVSAGDRASEIVAEHGLGEVVPIGDVAATRAALVRLLRADRAAIRDRFDPVIASFTWPHVAEPLVRFALAPRRAPDRALPLGPFPLWDAAREERLAATAALDARVRGLEGGRVMRLLLALERRRQKAKGKR